MLLFLLVALAVAIPPTMQQSWVYGPGKLGHGFYRRMFEGQDFCRNRSPRQCCESRNDECTISKPRFRGTLCYCDDFCDDRDRTQHDCCPDYHHVCQKPPQGCTARQFECTRQFQCIDLSQRCDNRVDCSDRSDEDRCNAEGTIVSSIVPDVVHLADYPLQRQREFTCKFDVKNHDHKIRLHMFTEPASGVEYETLTYEKEYDYQTSGELTGRLPIRSNIDINDIVCKGYNRQGDEKFALRSHIKAAGKQHGHGLAAPDYAKCVTVVNETPYPIEATVNYSDEHGHAQDRQSTINRYAQYKFEQVDFQEPGATYRTAIPVRRLTVTAAQAGFNVVEDAVQVSGVHDCVERKVKLDTRTQRLSIE